MSLSTSSLQAEHQFDTSITEPLFQSKRFADFTFCVKGVHVKAHRFILAQRCKTAPWQDGLDKIREWHERTIDVETLNQMLEFIYTNKIPANATEQLMLAANNYGVLDLKVALERGLVADLNLANAVSMLSLIESNPCASEDVKNDVHSFIRKNIRGPMGKSLFKELTEYSTDLAFEMLNLQ